MGNLADSTYERTIHDYEASKKRDKVKKFVGVAISAALVLGLGVEMVNIFHNFTEFNTEYQKELSLKATKPLVYDAGNINGCKVQYIDTAHDIGDNTLIRDVYMKSDCNGNVSINRLNMVKTHIQFNRMKLVESDTSPVIKPKM